MIQLTQEFLEYEHTDGLNYINIGLRRFDKLISLKNISLNLIEGIGIGALLPKTNATLLSRGKNDSYFLSGYGMDVMAGLNLTFFNAFFFQSEWKGGFMNMPNIRISQIKADNAKQSFFFLQYNIVLGANIRLGKK